MAELEKIRNSISGKRLKFFANIGTIGVSLIILFIILFLIGIYDFQKLRPYIVKAFSILILLIILL